MNTQSENNTDSSQPIRRKGNVARLPKPLRDLVNSMLDDGKSYPDIVTALENSTDPKLPHPVTARNIGNWFDGGYQDYLRDQAWRERLDANANRYLEVGLTDGTTLAAGGLYAASVQICKLMDKLCHDSAEETDPKTLVAISNALSRVSRSIVVISERQEHLAKLKAAEPKSKQARNKARQEMIEAMNELFGFAPMEKIDKFFGITPPAKGRDDRAASSALSEGRDDRAASSVSQISNLKSEIANNTEPSGGDHRAPQAELPPSSVPTASASETRAIVQPKTDSISTNCAETIAPKPEPITLPDPAPTTPAEDDERPWNWNQLSAEQIAAYREQKRQEKLAASPTHDAIIACRPEPLP